METNEPTTSASENGPDANQQHGNRKRDPMQKKLTAAAIAASLLGGGAAGIVLAQTGTTQAATPAASAQPSASTAPGKGGPGFGGCIEKVTDTSVEAQSIGISESDLLTALRSGKSMADVAKANNVDVQKVIDALVADGQAELADAVTAGRLTQAQADELKAGIIDRITARVNAAGEFAGEHGHGHFGGPRGGLLDLTVAQAIDISESDLLTALRSGKSMADVAKANNVDVQKVIDALVADGQSKLDQLRSALPQQVTDEVNRAGGFSGGPRFGGPRGGEVPLPASPEVTPGTNG